jgi:putative FmdB family regulatory protein
LPIYEYRCTNGHVFEVMQSMSDDPILVCEQCGAPVERVFHPVAVHFKGKGFYSTDYGRSRSSASASSTDSGDSGDSSDSGGSGDSGNGSSKSDSTESVKKKSSESSSD